MGSRKDMLERKRAMETARNTLYSKIGMMVMGGNKLPDRQHDITIQKLNRELKSQNQFQENDMKRFKRNRLIYNLRPTLIVERPPSPFAIREEEWEDPTRPPIPHYMQPTKRGKGATTKGIDLPTMDALVPKMRKKMNIWEMGLGGGAGAEGAGGMKFRSLVRASPDLSREENSALKKNWEKYRPVSREEEMRRRAIIEKQKNRLALIETRRPPSMSAFITQMPRFTMDDSDDDDDVDVDKSVYLQFNKRDVEKFERMRERQMDRFRDVVFR